MSMSYIESLPERCLELILDYLSLDDFNSTVKCCERLRNTGREVCRMREIRFHQVLRQNGLAKWRLLHSKDGKSKEISPGQRFGSTLVYYESSLYLFGGATINWTSFNDLWRFDLNKKEWSRRITRGTCPPPRASANGIIHKNKLIIIGGFELLYSLHAKCASNWDNLPWIYDFTMNEWRMFMVDKCLLPVIDDNDVSDKFTITPTPVGQSSCLLLGDKLILFGGAKSLLNQSQGYHRHNPIHPFGLSNDTYELSIHTSEIRAIKVFGDVKPLKRCGHSAMAIDDNKMVIIGGNLGPNTKGTEDMWMLTCVDAIRSRCLCDTDGGYGASDCPVWYWTKIDINPRLQPQLAFLGSGTVFTGENKVTSTIVVLGGPGEECQCGMGHPDGTCTRPARLTVHSMDMSSLLTKYHCEHAVLSQVSWTVPVPAWQDLDHAPTIRNGFGLVFGDQSLFMYGGLSYKSVTTKPVYLLNDLMVRDSDTDHGQVVSNADLYELSVARATVTL